MRLAPQEALAIDERVVMHRFLEMALPQPWMDASEVRAGWRLGKDPKDEDAEQDDAVDEDAALKLSKLEESNSPSVGASCDGASSIAICCIWYPSSRELFIVWFLRFECFDL